MPHVIIDDEKVKAWALEHPAPPPPSPELMAELQAMRAMEQEIGGPSAFDQFWAPLLPKNPRRTGNLDWLIRSIEKIRAKPSLIEPTEMGKIIEEPEKE